jgi:hypothetical protein
MIFNLHISPLDQGQDIKFLDIIRAADIGLNIPYKCTGQGEK